MSIEKLPTNANLKQVMDKFEEISLMDFSSIDIITAKELPETGKEGQVCIITQYESNAIYMSFDEPTLSEKDIHIKMDKNDPFKEFKIVSSNKVLSVRLRSVVQIQGGEKTSLSGYIMENGVWISLSVKSYLFKEGVGDITDITGGYSSYVSKPDSSSPSTIQMSTSLLKVVGSNGYNSSSGTATAVTKNSINVTGYSKLKAIVTYSYTYKSSAVASNIYANLGLSQDNGNNGNFVKNIRFSMSTGAITKSEIELDISDLNGEYCFKAFASAILGSSQLTIHEAWLE